jgi:hypothetical protein
VAKAEPLPTAEAGKGGSLRLRCLPDDAVVEVNGIPQGSCAELLRSEELPLGGGMNQIDVKRAGYWPYRSFLSPSGVSARIDVALTPVEHKAGAEP